MRFKRKLDKLNAKNDHRKRTDAVIRQAGSRTGILAEILTEKFDKVATRRPTARAVLEKLRIWNGSGESMWKGDSGDSDGREI